MEQQRIKVFVSYSREDNHLRARLENHLSQKWSEEISFWHDRQITAGLEWEKEIDRHMQTADIILLLISPDFVASSYCYKTELPKAMAQHKSGEACVVPILLRSVTKWENMQFAKLQIYPNDGVPITRWENEDKAFANVAQGISIPVERIFRQRAERLKQERLKQKKELIASGVQPFWPDHRAVYGKVVRVIGNDRYRVVCMATQWTAHSIQPLKEGDQVEIIGRKGITLFVEPWINDRA
jgi:hypothetical protein